MRASLALIVLAACGDPLVDGDYRGEPLATLNGSVLVDGLGPESQPNVRVALFWATVEGELGAEQAVVTTTAFPAQYTLSLYHPPPTAALFSARWTDHKIAVATPMLYLDEDGDEQYNADEDELVGGSPNITLVWSAEVSGDSPQGAPEDEFFDLRPGFQRMWADRPVCEGDKGTFYFPADGEPVDLWVGPFWNWLHDWDCDGTEDEWGIAVDNATKPWESRPF